MSNIDYEETNAETNRRSNNFRLERSISIGSIISLIALLVAITSAYNGIISRFDHYERAAIKSDVMWEHFIREHTDISQDELQRVR